MKPIVKIVVLVVLLGAMGVVAFIQISNAMKGTGDVTPPPAPEEQPAETETEPEPATELEPVLGLTETEGGDGPIPLEGDDELPELADPLDFVGKTIEQLRRDRGPARGKARGKGTIIIFYEDFEYTSEDGVTISSQQETTF